MPVGTERDIDPAAGQHWEGEKTLPNGIIGQVIEGTPVRIITSHHCSPGYLMLTTNQLGDVCVKEIKAPE
jgi:hypothetical protein